MFLILLATLIGLALLWTFVGLVLYGATKRKFRKEMPDLMPDTLGKKLFIVFGWPLMLMLSGGFGQSG
jgi:hypothetical protein